MLYNVFSTVFELSDFENEINNEGSFPHLWTPLDVGWGEPRATDERSTAHLENVVTMDTPTPHHHITTSWAHPHHITASWFCGLIEP